MRRALVRLPTVLVAVLALGCAKSPASTPSARQAGAPLGPGQTVATDAVVRYVGLEGGCWSLDTPQGSYGPAGLPTQYRVDGLPVYVVMRADTGVISLCMMGPLVSLDSIRAR